MTVTTAFLSDGTFVAVAAADAKSGQGMMDMKKHDTNGDGMLSKEEFMNMHESKVNRMKGANGMVAMKQFTGALHGHDRPGSIIGHDHQMPSHMGMGMK